jgi:hypothetical protein
MQRLKLFLSKLISDTLGMSASNLVRRDSLRQIDLEQLTHLSRPVLRLASRYASDVYFVNHCVNLFDAP